MVLKSGLSSKSLGTLINNSIARHFRILGHIKKIINIPNLKKIIKIFDNYIRHTMHIQMKHIFNDTALVY